MSAVAKQVSCYDQSSEVALEFCDIFYQKEHAEAKYSKSPGQTQRHAVKVARVEADGDNNGLAPESEQEGDGGVSALQAGPAGQAEAQVEEPPARVIARRLIDMGDRIDRSLTAELKTQFEKEFKNTSVFSFAYDHFSSVCLNFLSGAQGRIHAGWEQAYLLYYGHYVISQEIRRQDTSETSIGSSADRVESMSIIVRDLIHEIRLDEWIDNQGGWDNVGEPINGPHVVPIIPLPGPEGTSV